MEYGAVGYTHASVTTASTGVSTSAFGNSYRLAALSVLVAETRTLEEINVKCHRAFASCVAGTLGITLLTACADGQHQEPGRVPIGLYSAGDTGLSLQAYPISERISDLDSLRVEYIVFNSGSPRTINLQPDFFEYVLVSNGAADTLAWNEADVFYGDAYRTFLDTNAFVGRVVNLSFGFRTSWQRPEPGRLQIVVTYSPPPEPSESSSTRNSPTRDMSDTVVVRYEPAEP